MHPEYQWGYVKAKVGAVERSLQQLTINANDKENIMLLFGDMESTLYPFNPELFCKRNKALTDYMYFLRRCEVSHDKKR